jgi:hypothetical protein
VPRALAQLRERRVDNCLRKLDALDQFAEQHPRRRDRVQRRENPPIFCRERFVA